MADTKRKPRKRAPRTFGKEKAAELYARLLGILSRGQRNMLAVTARFLPMLNNSISGHSNRHVNEAVSVAFMLRYVKLGVGSRQYVMHILHTFIHTCMPPDIHQTRTFGLCRLLGKTC